MVIMCGATVKTRDKIELYALYLRISALRGGYGRFEFSAILKYIPQNSHIIFGLL